MPGNLFSQSFEGSAEFEAGRFAERDVRIHGVSRRRAASREDFPMVAFISKAQRFIKSEDGPTAVEYAVMLALILVACIGIVTTLGKSISGTFTTVNSALPASS